LPRSGPHDDAVHHHVDVVLVFLVEAPAASAISWILAVDLDALETLLLQFLQFLAGTRPCGRRAMGAIRLEPRCPSAIVLDAIDPSADTVWLSIGRPVAGE